MTIVMLKAFITICILFFPAQILIAQEETGPSITELNALLKKTKPDSGRVSLLLETGLMYITNPSMEKNGDDSAY